MDAVEPHN